MEISVESFMNFVLWAVIFAVVIVVAIGVRRLVQSRTRSARDRRVEYFTGKVRALPDELFGSLDGELFPDTEVILTQSGLVECVDESWRFSGGHNAVMFLGGISDTLSVAWRFGRTPSEIKDALCGYLELNLP